MLYVWRLHSWGDKGWVWGGQSFWGHCLWCVWVCSYWRHFCLTKSISVKYIQLFQVILSLHLNAECTKWHRNAVYGAHSVFAWITLLHTLSGCWLQCDCVNHCFSLMSWRRWRIPQYSNRAHSCFQISASSVLTNISKVLKKKNLTGSPIRKASKVLQWQHGPPHQQAPRTWQGS